MVAMNFLSRFTRSEKTVRRPNILTHLILRMSLGVFASMLPLLLFRFMVSFGLFLNEPLTMPNWQLNWGEAISATYILAFVISVLVAIIIQVATFTAKLHKRYGRFTGRFCTILVTGLSFIFPYMILMFVSRQLVLPMFIVACIVPVINFMVVSSATKEYLLRLRIYYDQLA